MEFDFVSAAKSIVDAAHAGNWKLVVAACLVAIVYAARRWGGAYWSFLKTDRGGAALALLGGVFGVVATGLGAGKELSMALILDGLAMGFTAAGGWAAAKKIFSPAPAVEPAK